MQTKTFLTRAIPLLGGVIGAGVMNIILRNQAGRMADELRKAANEDRIVADELIAKLEKLSQIDEFEAQQQALRDAHAAADALLGAIVEGSAQRAATLRTTANELITQLMEGARQLQDVFRPDPRRLARIRSAAAELTVLIDADVREERRPRQHATVAAELFENADRMAANDYGARERATAKVLDCATRLAA